MTRFERFLKDFHRPYKVHLKKNPYNDFAEDYFNSKVSFKSDEECFKYLDGINMCPEAKRIYTNLKEMYKIYVKY